MSTATQAETLLDTESYANLRHCLAGGEPVPVPDDAGSPGSARVLEAAGFRVEGEARH
jgi:hypothetical protein